MLKIFIYSLQIPHFNTDGLFNLIFQQLTAYEKCIVLFFLNLIRLTNISSMLNHIFEQFPNIQLSVWKLRDWEHWLCSTDNITFYFNEQMTIDHNRIRFILNFSGKIVVKTKAFEQYLFTVKSMDFHWFTHR